jgi:hypothetical protein
MSTVEEIERAVTGLSREDLTAFRRWFDEFDAPVRHTPTRASGSGSASTTSTSESSVNGEGLR